ncbi:hypothetical protein MMC31_004730 [Peltigera leucophlebia]|nr:hypothetical protein [Peltigera leucophlebia]
MSEVLPLPSAKSPCGGLEVPTLRETSLDPDEYLLRLAAAVRNNIADALGLPACELGPAESWLEDVSKFGLLDYDSEEDPEYCQEDKPSMETQEAVENSLEVLNECQINANTQADKNSMANVTEIPTENARPITQPADTENPRKRCASPAYHADLQNGSLRTNPQDSYRTEEPVTYLSDRVSKRQCLG